MDDDLYCKIYLNGVSGIDVLGKLLMDVFGCSSEGRSFRLGGLLVDVFDNRSAGHPAAAADEDDFVRWPFYLEVEPASGGDSRVFLEDLVALLKGLRSQGLKAIPSCSFEDRIAAAMAESL